MSMTASATASNTLQLIDFIRERALSSLLALNVPWILTDRFSGKIWSTGYSINSSEVAGRGQGFQGGRTQPHSRGRKWRTC